MGLLVSVAVLPDLSLGLLLDGLVIIIKYPVSEYRMNKSAFFSYTVERGCIIIDFKV